MSTDASIIPSINPSVSKNKESPKHPFTFYFCLAPLFPEYFFGVKTLGGLNP